LCRMLRDLPRNQHSESRDCRPRQSFRSHCGNGGQFRFPFWPERCTSLIRTGGLRPESFSNAVSKSWRCDQATRPGWCERVQCALGQRREPGWPAGKLRKISKLIGKGLCYKSWFHMIECSDVDGKRQMADGSWQIFEAPGKADGSGLLRNSFPTLNAEGN